MSQTFDLSTRFTARDDRQANRIAQVIGNALETAGIEVLSASLDPVAGEPGDESIPAAGTGYRERSDT